MITEMRADAKTLCNNLLLLIQDRQTSGETIGQVWRSKIKPREISSILSEIHRIAKWTNGDTSDQVIAVRTIKQATKNGHSDFASWTTVGDVAITEIYSVLEKACA